MKDNLVPLRHVKIAAARQLILDAIEILKPQRKTKAVMNWLSRVDGVLEGLPCKFQVGDLVRYRDPEGRLIDGVIIASVTCRERYVVGPGDDRNKRDPDAKLWMIAADQIERRQ